MKQIDKKYYTNPEQYIPKGSYCYDESGMCPFHDCDKSLPHQENGYCHYLKKSDYDINSDGGVIVDMKTGKKITVEHYPFSGLLWDQCKECRVNDEDNI